MEATRERLAGTIDQLVYRASPKTIARREITSIKGYFVDLQTGQPRTTNILKVAGGVLGVVVLFAVVRKVASRLSAGPPCPTSPRSRCSTTGSWSRSTGRAASAGPSGGIVIPATAAMGARRLVWSRVVAAGPHARVGRRSTTGCSSTPRTRPRSRCRARCTS